MRQFCLVCLGRIHWDLIILSTLVGTTALVIYGRTIRPDKVNGAICQYNDNILFTVINVSTIN